MNRWVAACLCFVFLVPFARADFLVLKDGRLVEGQKLTRAEKGITVNFKNGDVFVPEELIGEALIEGEVLAEATTPEEQDQRAKGMVRFEGRWISPKSRDDLLRKRVEKRVKEMEAMRAHSEWRNRHKVASKNFEFEHTLPPEVFEPYRDLMEAYFAQFMRDWKLSPPKGLGRLKVCLYSNYGDMITTGGAGSGVLGYFRFVPPLELNFFHERLDVEFTEEVMFHETNHYLQKLMDMDFSMPHFPGESLAEFYGASKWDPVKKKLTTGLILEGRLVEVQDDIAGGTMMDLKRLISTEGMYEHYNWGWTLVHYLMNDKRLAPKFQKFIVALPAAKDIKRTLDGRGLKNIEQADVFEAFMKYMDLRDDEALKAMEKEWHTYVKEKLTLVTPRGKQAAATSAMNSGRPIKAMRLFKEAIDAGATNPMVFHRYATLQVRQGKHAEANELWRKAIAIDPLVGEFHWGLGRSLRTKGDKAEGERMMRLAKELDPEGSYSDLDLGELKEG